MDTTTNKARPVPYLRQDPDPVLRQVCDPISEVDDYVRFVAAKMGQICDRYNGIGLAANQAGVPIRMFVMANRLWKGGDGYTAFVNPELSDFSGETRAEKEGCLSLLVLRATVRRPVSVTMRATTLDGEQVEERFAGLAARCVQHEVDHLNGVLIIDRREPLSKRANLRPSASA